MPLQLSSHFIYFFKKYINRYQSFGCPLGQASIPQTHPLTKTQNHPIKNPYISCFMPSLTNFRKKLALTDIDLISLKFPRFCGQNNEFTTWFSKVEQAFDCHNLSDQEKFKVVISKLRGCALQWWKNYKFKRRKKGKEQVRTWKKLRGKLMGAFCPPTYMLKHVSLLHKKNGSRPLCVDIHFNKGSPKIFFHLHCCNSMVKGSLWSFT